MQIFLTYWLVCCLIEILLIVRIIPFNQEKYEARFKAHLVAHLLIAFLLVPVHFFIMLSNESLSEYLKKCFDSSKEKHNPKDRAYIRELIIKNSKLEIEVLHLEARLELMEFENNELKKIIKKEGK